MLEWKGCKGEVAGPIRQLLDQLIAVSLFWFPGVGVRFFATTH